MHTGRHASVVAACMVNHMVNHLVAWSVAEGACRANFGPLKQARQTKLVVQTRLGSASVQYGLQANCTVRVGPLYGPFYGPLDGHRIHSICENKRESDK